MADAANENVEVIRRPRVGQVWRPRRGGMWRTVVALHPGGVEWTASPNSHVFDQWETWDKWVRDTAAFTSAKSS